MVHAALGVYHHMVTHCTMNFDNMTNDIYMTNYIYMTNDICQLRQLSAVTCSILEQVYWPSTAFNLGHENWPSASNKLRSLWILPLLVACYIDSLTRWKWLDPRQEQGLFNIKYNTLFQTLKLKTKNNKVVRFVLFQFNHLFIHLFKH
jgi:hypothetical protein